MNLTVFDWPKTTYFHTPAKQWETMTDLRKLPQSQLSVRAEVEGRMVLLRIGNPSKQLAFQISAKAHNAKGEIIPGALWDENYIELMPAKRDTLCRFAQNLHGVRRYDSSLRLERLAMGAEGKSGVDSFVEVDVNAANGESASDAV